ncbi:MerR family transcriptional regulator [Deinococcus maricopensis]|uniref:Antibiotic resistance transcriptional regulator, MerR family n=1 Tax=Deinococcus maricopensis (strain DSM 21211 / LMG 22137 / NRRL B-23946 / LB-34) TaxID=709986 RepID=E8U4S1_DEIML|nr:MerR family transcriptional regulator [Deinococcus maricopensis]ADV66060.1 antibiotic resistance transcriptional regulator, MerR family [Deinococcus maricopensis DSM 21211]
MPWTVGDAARIARVSVRTLHHYDEIGLLRPSGRTAANYRLYTASDLERLHQILLFRELGFALPDIRRLMLDPDFDRAEALRAQRALLVERARRTSMMLSALDAALAATVGGTTMTQDEFKTLFEGFDPAQYEDEVKERWGDTDAYRQSSERTRRYTRDDWARLKGEMEAITARYVALMEAGVAPEAPEAVAVAAEHHAHLERWFYDCPPEMFSNLGWMWVGDERFTRNIDRARAGLAAYQCAAVQAWVARQ